METAERDAQVEGGEMTILNLYLRIILILLVFPTVSFAGQYRVTRVTDGDTIKVSRDGTTTTVRLVGIDAPETSKRKNEPGNRSVVSQPSILPVLC